MPDQRVLSDRFKAAIKTALAMVLAYGWFAADCIVNQPVLFNLAHARQKR